MELNDGPHTPQRRSLIPGASQELPVSHPDAMEPAEPDATSVFAADELQGAYGYEQTEGQSPEPAVEYADYPIQNPSQELPAEHEVPRLPAPWYRRTWVIATAAGVVVLGAGIGVIAALSGGGGAVAAPTSSPSPSPTQASPSASAAPVASLLDDGIDADEYPKAAKSAGAAYPEALVMEDWVWDRVGPTWALVSVAHYDAAAGTASSTVIYLASPEGVLFDLAHIDQAGMVAQVVSWLPSERKARIQLTPVSYEEEREGGALLNLQTGALEQMAFTMAGGKSRSESFQAASADGAELWSAFDDDYAERRFERWSPSGGWQRVLSDADLAQWTAVSSQDGSVVAVEIASSVDSGFASGRSGQPGEPVIVVYDVSTGGQAVLRPSYEGGGDSWCGLAAVSNEGDPIITCWQDGGERTLWAKVADGRPLTELSPTDLQALQLQSALYDATTATLADEGVTLVSAASDSQVYEVTVDSGGSPVTVLKAGSDVPFGGLSQFYATRVTDGVTLVRATEACAIVDTQNANGVVLAASDSGTIGCIGYGRGNGAFRLNGYWGE